MDGAYVIFDDDFEEQEELSAEESLEPQDIGSVEKDLQRRLNASQPLANWNVEVKRFNEDDSVIELTMSPKDLEDWNNEYESYIDDYEDRKSLEYQYDIEMPDTEWDAQSVFSQDDGALSGKTIEEAADIKDTSPNKISAMKEVYDGFKYGCYESLRSIQEMGSWLGWKAAELVTGEDIEFNPMKDTEGVAFNQGESPEMQTTSGNIAKVAGQAVSGYMLGGGIAKGVGAGLKGLPAIGKALEVLGKNPWGKKLINMTIESAKGFVADTLSFNSNEENLMGMLKEMGLPTIEAIATNENDTFWERKIKNGVDGILAGAIIGFIGGTAKLIWNTLPADARAAAIATGATSLAVKGVEELTEEGKDNGQK